MRGDRRAGQSAPKASVGKKLEFERGRGSQGVRAHGSLSAGVWGPRCFCELAASRLCDLRTVGGLFAAGTFSPPFRPRPHMHALLLACPATAQYDRLATEPLCLRIADLIRYCQD